MDVADSQNIYCFAGASYSSIDAEYVQIFDPVLLTMDSSTYQLNGARYDFVLLRYQNCMYIIGGSDSSDNFQQIEYLCLDTDTDTQSPTIAVTASLVFLLLYN
jgi:hypothetical protein